ncbi:MAG TPA: hypothetical protein VIJ38_18275, partial [Acidobacteriaceae bacterium]
MAIAASSGTRWGETTSEQSSATKEGSDDSSRNAVPRAVRQVYELDPLSDSRWPALVASHPQASVFHTHAWLSALKVTYGYRPLVLTTSAPRAPLTDAIVFCEVDSWLTGRRLVSLPFSDHCEPLLNEPAALAPLLAHARSAVEA